MSIKLFIGQIPRSYDEDTIKEMLQDYGEILEVTLIKNKQTNQPQGCAFVTLANKDLADKAITDLHDSKKFPGVSNNLQVKYADSEQEKLSTKLFVGMLPRSYQEEEIKTLFSQYGSVEEICLLRYSNKESKGCGFIKFDSRDSCIKAIEDLAGKKIEGSTNNLVVKFADTESDKKKKQKQMQQMQRHQHLQQLTQMTSPFVPQKMNPQPLFAVNPFMNAMPNFNFLPIESPSLLGTPPIIGDGVYDFYNGGNNGNGGVNNQTQQMYRNQNQQNQNMNMVNMMPNGGGGYGIQNQNQNQNAYGATNTGYNQATGMQQQNLNIYGQNGNGNNNNGNVNGNNKKQLQGGGGPPGANLFAYNIPNIYTDSDLYHLFQPYGFVLSSKVYIDKTTGLGKGYGFVSFDNPSSASLAISNLNGFILGGKKLKVSLKSQGGGGNSSGGNVPY